MIEEKPALRRFDRNRTRADFCALPAIFGCHDKAVLAPMDQIRAATQENIAKRGMAAIAGAA